MISGLGLLVFLQPFLEYNLKDKNKSTSSEKSQNLTGINLFHLNLNKIRMRYKFLASFSEENYSKFY